MTVFVQHPPTSTLWPLYSIMERTNNVPSRCKTSRQEPQICLISRPTKPSLTTQMVPKISSSCKRNLWYSQPPQLSPLGKRPWGRGWHTAWYLIRLRTPFDVSTLLWNAQTTFHHVSTLHDTLSSFISRQLVLMSKSRVFAHTWYIQVYIKVKLQLKIELNVRLFVALAFVFLSVEWPPCFADEQ